MNDAILVEFTLNGEPVTVNSHPLRRLLDVLREEFGLTGTKEGCGEGECGACAVLMDGKLINACLVPMGTLAKHDVTTIEGFRNTKRFEVIKAAYETEGGVQCGFCTPGMVLATEALLSSSPHPSRDEIASFLSGNLCRCTGYDMIIKSVITASKEGDGLW
ncbi:MAG TPA: ferredoxin [Clostridiales bacterium UBA8960]|nr:ferredoxin [Clostridiales bacterium UBA8960]